MSTPIFDGLANSYAASMKTYDSLVNWTAPAFVWGTQPAEKPKGIMAPGMFFTSYKAAPEAVVEDTDTLGLPVITLVDNSPTICPPGVGAEVLKTFLEKHGHRITEDQRRIAMKFPDAIQARLNPDGSVEIQFDSSAMVVPSGAPAVKPLSEREPA